MTHCCTNGINRCKSHHDLVGENEKGSWFSAMHFIHSAIYYLQGRRNPHWTQGTQRAFLGPLGVNGSPKFGPKRAKYCQKTKKRHCFLQSTSYILSYKYHLQDRRNLWGLGTTQIWTKRKGAKYCQELSGGNYEAFQNEVHSDGTNIVKFYIQVQLVLE